MKHCIEGFITHAWYKQSPTSLWLLLPFSFVFYLMVLLRRALYRIGVLKSTKLPVPVIVVGNITVGGTGKTPLTIALIKHLQVQGKHPGVLMHGYGTHLSAPMLVSQQSKAEQVGDEALLISQSTNVPVAVFPKRVQAAPLLIEQGCDVIIADDGLQHYALQRDVEIVMVDAKRGMGNGWLLPAGPLREPVSRLKQTAFVVTNGGEGAMHMQLVAGQLQALGEHVTVPQPGDEIHAVCAIGHPARFEATLRTAGYKPKLHAFADHHPYTAADFSHLQDLPIIMTGKDAVKCRSLGLVNAFELPVEATLSDDFWAALDDKLATIG